MLDKSHLIERYSQALVPISTGLSPRLVDVGALGAVLFDVYGTLLISASGETGLHEASDGLDRRLHHVIERHGIHKPADILCVALKQAITREHARCRKNGIDHPEVDIVQIWKKVLGWNDLDALKAFALEFELAVNPVFPMPGLRAVLSACRSQKLPAGIISNAQFYTIPLLEWFLDTTLDNSGFDYRLIFLSYLSSHAKPSKRMFEQAKKMLREMNIPAEKVLYVGNDLRNDIHPATRMGFKTALFAGDKRSLRLRKSDAECRHLSPDLVITDLGQLISVIRHNKEARQ